MGEGLGQQVPVAVELDSERLAVLICDISGTRQRQRASEAPLAAASASFEWNDWDPLNEAPLPETLSDEVQCSCDTPEPCAEGGPPYPWTRQIDLLTIAPEDA